MAKTVITAQVIDQSMLLTNLPALASGGIDEIQVEFSFCDLWADASSKTAVFYRDKTVVYHATINNDICVAPWEAFTTEGTVFIGVFAEYADGTTRTTAVIPLEIVQGAITTNTAPSETPNIYSDLEQRIRLVESKLSALPISVSDDGYTEISGMRQMTDFSVARDGQTVTVTLTFEGNVTETHVITCDENDFPVKIVSNGAEVSGVWSGF